MTQTSLDKTREEAKAKINEDLQRLEEITSRLAQNRRVLELAKKRAKVKAIYLLDELEEKEEAKQIQNNSVTDAKLKDLSRKLIAYYNASKNAGTEIFSVQNSLNPSIISISPIRSLDLSQVGQARPDRLGNSRLSPTIPRSS